MSPRLSLKGRALQWLAQREHSRLELHRKLLRCLREDACRDDTGAQGLPADGRAEVESVLDWLQAHRYLSDERFVESRVHARARARRRLPEPPRCAFPRMAAFAATNLVAARRGSMR